MIEFENGVVKPSDYLLTIPCFNKAYKEDKTKEKKHFYDLLLYIFYMYDTRSPYSDYPENTRHANVIKDIFRNVSPNINPQLLAECKEVYEKAKPVELFLTEKALSTAYKLAEYLDTISFLERDDEGQLKNNPKDIVAILKSIGDIINSLKNLRKQSKQAVENEDYIEKEMFEDM